MAKRPDTPCAGCGQLLWSGSGSKPAGERLCRACRSGGYRAPTERSDVASAAASGRLAVLGRLRDHLAALIDDPATAARDQIAAVKELRAVVAEIDTLTGKKPDAETQGEEAGVVDLAAAIAAKRAASTA